MTQEEKQLLLIDLCARLPYGVMYATEYGPRIINDLFIYSNGPVYTDHGIGDYNEVYGIELENIKPYLRPMSSITEKENKEFQQVIEIELKALEGPGGHTIESAASSAFQIDFYNKRHIDYRGLIPMGLALEAPEDMYKIESL